MIPSFSARGLGLLPTLDERALSAISDAGFRAVDLLIRDLIESGTGPGEMRRRLEEHGLVPGTCPLPIDWRGRCFDERSILDKLPPLLEFADRIGVVRVYTRVAESIPEGESAADVIDDHCRKLIAIANLLSDFGIGLGLESIGVRSFRRGRPPLMATLSDTRRALAQVFDECPNVGLLVDVFHLHAAGESVEEAIGPFADRVFGIHVADLPGPTIDPDDIQDDQRALPATTGQVPVRTFLRDLKRAGCPESAPVIVETIRCPEHLRDAPFDEITRAVFRSLAQVSPE